MGSDKPELDLSHSGLTVLPAPQGRFAFLRSLNLSGNDISELPQGLLQLSVLQELQLKPGNGLDNS